MQSRKGMFRHCEKVVFFMRDKWMSLGLFLVTSPLFAQSNDLIPQGLQTTAENVQEIFTGDMAKIIMGCCFAGSCIAYGYNKDNDRMKGKMVAVVVATGLLVLTQQVMDKLWTMN